MKERLVTTVSTSRTDRVLADLREWNDELSPSDLVVKMCRMTSAPLFFYRGTNHLFWRDFANDQRLQRFGEKEPRTWIQGDLHVYNFGSYDNRKDEVVYDINDFDEALVADYQYDLWRMAVSILLAARQNGDLSFNQQEQVIDGYSRGYLESMAFFSRKKRRRRCKKISFTASNTSGILRRFLQSVSCHYSRKGMLDRWTQKEGDEWRLKIRNGKLKEASKAEHQMIIEAMPAYRKTLNSNLAKDDSYFRVVDVGRRLQAGTGSLGTRRFYVLIKSDGDGSDGYRILDVKQQRKPVAYHYLGKRAQSKYDNEFENDAQRHAVAYRRLTCRTDHHLGWMELDDGTYSVRERSPYKEAFPCEVLDTRTSFSEMGEYWAESLAAKHSRVNKKLCGFIGSWTDDERSAFCALVRAVAFEYADQVLADWKTLVDALIVAPAECGKSGVSPISYRRMLPY